ncbi:hypothetical protein BRADI_2g27693v3 [Brachypodium distachyon]|uniref:Uncharacterized protein n=1 Tax=Brachypodium distachyon TaxID=15368 RepID=A0A2K2DAY9_BRADI|nr:hypothetical protein BRADI_2g27693v3 [Brachypodium distachyon]
MAIGRPSCFSLSLYFSLVSSSRSRRHGGAALGLRRSGRRRGVAAALEQGRCRSKPRRRKGALQQIRARRCWRLACRRSRQRWRQAGSRGGCVATEQGQAIAALENGAAAEQRQAAAALEGRPGDGAAGAAVSSLPSTAVVPMIIHAPGLGEVFWSCCWSRQAAVRKV